MLVLLALTLLLASLLSAGAAGRGPHPAFTVTLSATPSSADPLQIAFTAAAITGTPTAYGWDFGDGQFLNGSGVGNSSPVHRYASPGTYTVNVVVFEGALQSSSALVVSVAPGPLRVAITVTNATGPAPLTATFTAVITGGTGTFRSVLWRFGDGGVGVGPTIAYSYVRAGDFQVEVNVTDSSGSSASGQRWVNVSAVASEPEFLGLSAGSLAGIVGITAVVGAVGGGLVARWWSRRRPDPIDPDDIFVPAGALTGTASAAPASAPIAVPPPVVRPAPSTSPAAEAPSPAGAVAARTPPGATLAADDNASGAASTVAVTPARAASDIPRISPTALRLSQRIVLHLQTQGALGPDEVAPVAFTQQGMSEALTVRQNALTNVLRRLVAAEVLMEDVRHVQGQPRRLKVYRLTTRGEAVAHDLRAHRRPPA